jgi:hypothetical protein
MPPLDCGGKRGTAVPRATPLSWKPHRHQLLGQVKTIYSFETDSFETDTLQVSDDYPVATEW